MATYAIGDIQGCYSALRRLVTALGFRSAHDTLWLAGDVVNRGPASCAVLRYIADLPHVVMVLGNHDLHLVGVHTQVESLHHKDTFHDVLEAPDGDQLVAWLRRQPFLHHDPDRGYTMVHAGLIPPWDIAEAQGRADRLSACLQSAAPPYWLAQLVTALPTDPHTLKTAEDRLLFDAAVFTRLRYCTPSGCLDLVTKGRERVHAQAGSGYGAWFDMPNRRTAGERILFGHWAALEGYTGRKDSIALDTGCGWGRTLTAYCLETGAYTQVDALP